MNRGIVVDVYLPARWGGAGQCSNGGISEFHTEAVVPHPRGNIDLDDTRGLPVVEIVKGNLPGLVKAVPRDGAPFQGSAVGPMASGAFIWSSDSRFKELSKYPVPLHDRWESPELYRLLSQ